MRTFLLTLFFASAAFAQGIGSYTPPTSTATSIGAATLSGNQTFLGTKTFSAGLISTTGSFSGTLSSTVASGSTALAIVQGSKLCFDSSTNAKCFSSDGSNLSLSTLGLNVAGFSFFVGAQFSSNVIVQGTLQIGSSGTAISNSYSATSTIDFASTTSTTLDSSGITVTGAVVGKPCIVGVPTAAAVTGADFSCYVSATDTVKVRFTATGAAIDPASGVFTVRTF